MKSTEIIEAVKNYIKDENAKYAILIDGSWGSGKTYLYEKHLVDAIESIELGKGDSKQNVYISLYGLSDIESLSKLLITNYLVYGVAKGNNIIKKGIDPISKILGTFASAFSFSIGPVSADLSKVSEVVDVITQQLNIENLVICFDDLERCTIPVNELFGYINNLVEHCNCKVIILADENNIGKIYANTNLELKYRTILSGNRLVIDRRENGLDTNKHNNNTEKNEYEISFEDLKKLNEKLFSDNYIYNDIKEKVVGKTLHYFPDLEEVICELINDNKISLGDQYKEFIVKHIKEISSAFDETKDRNIRTLKLWIFSFKKIYDETTKNYSRDKNYENMLVEYIRYSIWVWVSIKNNKKIIQNSNYIREGRVYFEEHEYNHAFSYSFIDGWISRDAWVDEDFSNACKLVIARKNREDIVRPSTIISKGEALERLRKWRYMDDEQLETEISILENEVKDNKYAYCDYSSIIYFLVELNEMGVSSENNLLNIQKSMIELIKNDSKVQEEDELFFDHFTEEQRKEFKKIYQPISEERKKRNREINKEEQEEENIYRDASSFLDDCIKRENYYFRQKTFVRFLEFEKLFKLINESNNEGIYIIIKAFNKVYNMSNLKEFYLADVEGLKMLRKSIMDPLLVKQEGKTRQVALKCLAERICYFLILLGEDEDQLYSI